VMFRERWVGPFIHLVGMHIIFAGSQLCKKSGEVV